VAEPDGLFAQPGVHGAGEALPGEGQPLDVPAQGRRRIAQDRTAAKLVEAALLGLDRLFQAERDDGSLDLILMQETPLVLTVFVKCLAHWVATNLPLVIASPLLGLFMNMNEVAIGAVMLTLLVGSPAITFIGAAGAAVAVALPRGGLLVSILVLPLAIPVLIFGVSASYAAVEDPAPFMPPFLFLIAITLFFAVIGPLGAALALRSASD
jgi:heme exporter protein B